jgi:hypothetical protein
MPAKLGMVARCHAQRLGALKLNMKNAVESSYVVISPSAITVARGAGKNRDYVTFQPGQVCEIEPVQAARLLHAGIVRPAGPGDGELLFPDRQHPEPIQDDSGLMWPDLDPKYCGR